MYETPKIIQSEMKLNCELNHKISNFNYRRIINLQQFIIIDRVL
jgi:hypothetical protein